jgi:hypothetical protein
VLPSWRDEVRIALQPDRVALARVSRRWRPQVSAKHVVQCSAHGTAPGTPQGTPPGTPNWQPCLEALREALQQLFARDADAHLVISNHFVRYALVPWSEHLASDEEKRAWVRHHFAELYGEPEAAAEYRWSEEAPDAACVASALDAEFIGGIRAAFEPTSLRLRSVQPYLMAAFNRWQRRVEGDPVWIVLPETGRVCIASLANGRWRTIAARNIGADWQAELPLALKRELLLADGAAAPATVWAYAPEAPKLDFPEWTGVPLEFLAPRAMPGFSPQADAEYAIALTGVA